MVVDLFNFRKSCSESKVSEKFFSRSTSGANLVALEVMVAQNVMNKNLPITYKLLDQEFMLPISSEISDHQILVKSHSVIFKAKDPSTQRKVIICVHGANSGPSIWFDTAPSLVQQDYEVHCVALPGFGESEVSTEILKLSPTELKMFYVQYFLAYVKSNCLSVKPCFIGHSFGGFLISCFASIYPDMCASLVLVNAAGIFPIFGRETMRWGALFKSGFPNFYMRQIGYVINVAVFAYYSVYKNSNALDHWNIAQMTCRDNFGESVVANFVNFNGFGTSWNCSTFAEFLNTSNPVPLSLVWGSDDTIMPLKYATMIAECAAVNKNETITPMKVYTISNVWHNPVSDTKRFTKALNLALQDFRCLRSIDSDQRVAIEDCTQGKDWRLGVKARCSFSFTEETIDTMYSKIRDTLGESSPFQLIEVEMDVTSIN